MWLLVETQIDIPDESTFDDLRADLLVLETNFASGWTASVAASCSSASIPCNSLRSSSKNWRIGSRRRVHDLEKVEDKIEEVVKEWHAESLSEATRARDEERTVRSQQIDLVAHRIGTLELEAKKFALGVEEEINKVDAESDSLKARQQIRQLEMELATKMAEFENRRAQLNARKELDLIVLNKEAEVDQRSELRWLLSWKMTQMNIAMQLESIETQIDEYKRQKDTNSNRPEQIQIERSQKERAIKQAEIAIASADLQKQQLNTQMDGTFRQKRAVAREGICRIEKQLAFVGASPDKPFVPLAGEQPCDVPQPAFTRAQFVQRMCGDANNPGLRKKLSTEKIRARAFLLQCIVGSANFSDLKPMVANDLRCPRRTRRPGRDCRHQDRLRILRRNRKGFCQEDLGSRAAGYGSGSGRPRQAARRPRRADRFGREMGKAAFSSTAQQLATGVQAAEATLAALSAIPEISVHIAGLASGSSTKIDLSKAAAATVEALRSTLNTALKVGEVEQSTKERIDSLTGTLTEIQQQMKQVDFNRAMKAVALHKAHFELAGRRAEGSERDEGADAPEQHCRCRLRSTESRYRREGRRPPIRACARARLS